MHDDRIYNVNMGGNYGELLRIYNVNLGGNYGEIDVFVENCSSFRC